VGGKGCSVRRFGSRCLYEVVRVCMSRVCVCLWRRKLSVVVLGVDESEVGM
jgi:hypothetical protein